MYLSETLAKTLSQTPAQLDKFSHLIDLGWIEQALAHTGKASIRKRKLPAEHVVRLVIGLALFRNQPVWFVVQQLQLVFGEQESCAPSAIVQARQRLGHEPLKMLFDCLSLAWFKESKSQHDHFHGLNVLAVDGTVFSVPHTPENLHYFGSSQGKTAQAPYPQVRAVCLINTHSHEMLDAQIGDMRKGELTLARELTPPACSLTLFDRAYFSADFLLHWQQAEEQSHWLMPAKDNLRHEVSETYGPGDYRICMPVSPRARKLNPSLDATWEARLLVVESNGKRYRYITSLLDSGRYPKKALVGLYRQRWEIELCYREIKADLQDGMLLGSRQPELVQQELWGIFIAYNLLRRQMRCMADHLKLSPLRLSFHVTSIAIINLLRHSPLESAGTLPKQLAQLMNQAHLFVIPERRNRSCPRVVKGRPAKYPKKMPLSP